MCSPRSMHNASQDQAGGASNRGFRQPQALLAQSRGDGHHSPAHELTPGASSVPWKFSAILGCKCSSSGLWRPVRPALSQRPCVLHGTPILHTWSLHDLPGQCAWLISSSGMQMRRGALTTALSSAGVRGVARRYLYGQRCPRLPGCSLQMSMFAALIRWSWENKLVQLLSSP